MPLLSPSAAASAALLHANAKSATPFDASQHTRAHVDLAAFNHNLMLASSSSLPPSGAASPSASPLHNAAGAAAMRFFHSASTPHSPTSADSQSIHAQPQPRPSHQHQHQHYASHNAAISSAAGMPASSAVSFYQSMPDMKTQLLGARGVCSSIVDRAVYMGDEDVAANEKLLRNIGITHVLNCAASIIDNHFPTLFSYKSLFLGDRPSENILCLFDQVVEFIDTAVQSGGMVLIHCRSGVSRSCAIAMCYLMLKYSLDYSAALQYVKAKRQVCEPNLGYAIALMEWSSQLGTRQPSPAAPAAAAPTAAAAAAPPVSPVPRSPTANCNINVAAFAAAAAPVSNNATSIASNGHVNAAYHQLGHNNNNNNHHHHHANFSNNNNHHHHHHHFASGSDSNLSHLTPCSPTAAAAAEILLAASNPASGITPPVSPSHFAGLHNIERSLASI
jgi:hypothetical protein